MKKVLIFQVGEVWERPWYRVSFASLVAQRLKRLPPMWETWVRSLGREDPLEKEMAIHSSILAWRIPWTEKPSSLQSTGWQRVGHDWVTSPHLYKWTRRKYILSLLLDNETYTISKTVLMATTYCLAIIFLFAARGKSIQWKMRVWFEETCHSAFARLF